MSFMVIFTAIALVVGFVVGIEIERRYKVSESALYHEILHRLGQNMERVGHQIATENSGQPLGSGKGVAPKTN